MRLRRGVLDYLKRSERPGAFYSSSLGGPPTLYATAYATSVYHYLGEPMPNLELVKQALLDSQSEEDGCFRGPALDDWFAWLDREADPKTGLWGTNGFCPVHIAIYGGYPHLLLYYYEQRPVLFPRELVDATLSIQHLDGGFHPGGGGPGSLPPAPSMWRMSVARRARDAHRSTSPAC